jgi:hypothetical protein
VPDNFPIWWDESGGNCRDWLVFSEPHYHLQPANALQLNIFYWWLVIPQTATILKYAPKSVSGSLLQWLVDYI